MRFQREDTYNTHRERSCQSERVEDRAIKTVPRQVQPLTVAVLRRCACVSDPPSAPLSVHLITRERIKPRERETEREIWKEKQVEAATEREEQIRTSGGGGAGVGRDFAIGGFASGG